MGLDLIWILNKTKRKCRNKSRNLFLFLFGQTERVRGGTVSHESTSCKHMGPQRTTAAYHLLIEFNSFTLPEDNIMQTSAKLNEPRNFLFFSRASTE